MSYLLLAQDEGPSCFDGVPGWQVLPRAFLHPILVGLPDAVACRPCHAYVMPLPICHGYGQCHRLNTQGGRQVDRDRHTINGEDRCFWVSTPCWELLLCHPLWGQNVSLIWIKLFKAFIKTKTVFLWCFYNVLSNVTNTFSKWQKPFFEVQL